MKKDIATYNCDKTIAYTKQNMRETETDLKNITAKEEYFQIEKTIKTNEADTKRPLHQRKFQKFYSLKHKPETTREEIVQPSRHKDVTKTS